MKLQPYHFQTPERPTEEKDLAEWESLYGEEPELELIDISQLKEMLPIDHIATCVYYADREIIEVIHNNNGDLKFFGYQIQKRDVFDEMSDKKFYVHQWHQSRLQRWKDHQVKFPGFKKHVYRNSIIEFSKTVKDKMVNICFYDTWEIEVIIINDQNEIIFEMTSSDLQVEEVEMIFKNRDIKL